MNKVAITTTFKQLHDNGACIDRYRHLAKTLGGIKKYGRITPINLLTILEHNGLDDFFWTLNILDYNQIYPSMRMRIKEAAMGAEKEKQVAIIKRYLK